MIIFGHEPGGGVAPQCEATDPAFFRTFFFYDGEDGTKLGQWTLPRTQSATENCTLHNYNTVPLKNGRDLIVHGSYQSGTSVVEFTDPGERGGAGLVRPAADRPDRPRRRVVVLLVQRLHLRDEHHRGPEHLRVHGPAGARAASTSAT